MLILELHHGIVLELKKMKWDKSIRKWFSETFLIGSKTINSSFSPNHKDAFKIIQKSDSEWGYLNWSGKPMLGFTSFEEANTEMLKHKKWSDNYDAIRLNPPKPDYRILSNDEYEKENFCESLKG